MKILCGSLFLFIVTLSICLWCAFCAENAAKDLTKAAEGEVAELALIWQKKKFCLCLTVNRSLIAACERSLAKMQTLRSNDPLFRSAQSEFLANLTLIRDSYGMHFTSIW